MALTHVRNLYSAVNLNNVDKVTSYESCLRLYTVARSLASGRILAEITRVCIYRKCFGNIHINYVYRNRPPPLTLCWVMS